MQEKKPINIQIGQNIRQTREVAGLTQEKLAEILGIGDKHVSAIERGAVGLSLPTLMRICEALSVSADRVLFGALHRQHLRVAGQRGQRNGIDQPRCLRERLERLPDRQFEAAKDVMDTVLAAMAIGDTD